MKESKIQSDTISLLASKGMLAFPIEYRNRRYAPDLMVFCLDRPKLVVFIELKKKGGRASHGQLENVKLFALWGHNVGICFSADEALAHCKEQFYGCKETKPAILHENNKARAQEVYKNTNTRLSAGFDSMA